MKITRFNIQHLRNDEFFQYMTRVRDMIRTATPAALKVEAVFGDFNAMYLDLDEALKKILKSAHTAEINELDHARDTVFNGMAGQVRSDLNHFDATKRAAAERLVIVLDTYGNVAARGHDEETSAVYNLLKELTEKHVEDVETLDLVPWVGELDRRNHAVEDAMKERFDETAARTSLVLRECRLAIGEVYYRLADRIDALQIVEGADAPGSVWGAFIAELNEIIDHTEAIVAIRRGKAAAAKARKEEEKEEAKQAAAEALKTNQ